ncbi:hypothetical protein CGLAMM_10780 [Acetobacteraceae bacterium EV16G]|uniref:Phage protein Gp138 N-terminal domain-containing protein n=1 Tax=Sorlinia euscelidii TaxID=3081148 RepID=A0ABU7U1D4_9PROT
MDDDVDSLPPLEAGLYHGSMRPFDSAQSFNAINSLIRRMLMMMGADTLVKVVAVNAEGTDVLGSVDVLPLVMQQTGDGHAVPHDVIYNVPYIRVQGGKTAIILDPQVGDIGAIMICGRDISGVKETRAASHPRTFRMHDASDAIYIGGLLNTRPETYIKLENDEITILAEDTTLRSRLDVTEAMTVRKSARFDDGVQVQGLTSLKGDAEVGGKLRVATGASGQFTTMNGHMIAVENGIVVAIS